MLELKLNQLEIKQMPKDFDQCVSNGGKVRTKSLGKGEYMHICFLNGKSYSGEVKKYKKILKGKK